MGFWMLDAELNMDKQDERDLIKEGGHSFFALLALFLTCVALRSTVARGHFPPLSVVSVPSVVILSL